MAKKNLHTDTHTDTHEEKTPLQEIKEEKLQEKLETEEVVKPKRKRGRRKKKVEEPVFDPIQAEAEAKASIEIISWVRSVLGVNKPLPEQAVALYIASYGEISKKYGTLLTKWMPEIMFGSAIAMIAYDTHIEIKKIKSKQEQVKEIKEKSEKVEPRGWPSDRYE